MSSPRQILESAVERGIAAFGNKKAHCNLEPPYEACRLSEEFPAEHHELLQYCSGISIPGSDDLERIRFSGDEYVSACCLESLLPQGLPIGHDGCGNFWIIEPQGNVYFLSHDPPAFALQARDLGEFLSQVICAAENPKANPLRQMREEWICTSEGNPAAITVEAAKHSSDSALASFASSLPDGYQIHDLRARVLGSGFSVDTKDPQSAFRCHKSLPIFAGPVPESSPKKRSWWSKLFAPIVFAVK